MSFLAETQAENKRLIQAACTAAETWRRVWGTLNFFRGPRFQSDVFSEKFCIFTPKNSYDVFFSHRPGFSDFPFLFPDSPYLCCVKCRTWPFLHKKTTISKKNSL